MATKKCPKCGEENPAEAVMCWACYTPLAGGAAAAAGGGLVTPRGGVAAVTPAATAAAEDKEKTPVDPKIFAAIGLLFAAAVIGSFTTGLISLPGKTGGLPNANSISGGDDGPPFQGPPKWGPQNQTSTPVVIQPTITTPNNPGGQTTGATQPKVVVPPDPRQPTGTMAIIVDTPNISPVQARSMAVFAKRQFERGGRWTGMQVVVFADRGAAKVFAKYQAQRRGAKLTPAQYQELANQNVWSSVPAYYETQGKTEMSYQPSAYPQNWWMGSPRRR